MCAWEVHTQCACMGNMQCVHGGCMCNAHLGMHAQCMCGVCMHNACVGGCMHNVHVGVHTQCVWGGAHAMHTWGCMHNAHMGGAHAMHACGVVTPIN